MKLSKRRHKLWRYKINQLRKHFNPGVPVEVRTRPMNCEADCDGVIKLGRLVKVVIRINSKSTWMERSDSLVHEWAHAMEWEANWSDESPKLDHGETWGVWYAAKIYQHLFDHCWEEMKQRKLLSPKQLKSE
jgi:hypothetical protein